MEKNVSQKLKLISCEVTERIGKKKYRSMQITGASCFGNTFVALGKFILGIYTLNFYICVSGLYTLGMVSARACALTGIIKEREVARQYPYYRFSGIILITASMAYITYSIRLLQHPQNNSYNEITGITIAAFTFLELGLNFRGILIERKNKTPLFYALKIINMASSLICLALTQTALLSFQETGTENSRWNGLMGILMGSIAVLLGVMMIQRIRKMQYEEE